MPNLHCIWGTLAKVLLLFALLAPWSSDMLMMLAIPAAFAKSETSLFDSRGMASAYIAPDLTIYLWSGEAVAYLHDAGSIHVYGFNGRHLGWLDNGIIFDNSGRVVCATRESIGIMTSIEPVKSIKHVKHVKSVRHVAPVRPIFNRTWIEESSTDFLRYGI